MVTLVNIYAKYMEVYVTKHVEQSAFASSHFKFYYASVCVFAIKHLGYRTNTCRYRPVHYIED